MNAEKKVKVLFLCTGNSCRSPMAEALANDMGRGKVQAFSAGVAPAAAFMPGAVEAMREIGIDISRQSPKSADSFTGEEFDYIITLCDNARETCPYFPGEAVRLHWPIPDPYGSDLTSYRRARDDLRRRIADWLQGLEKG